MNIIMYIVIGLVFISFIFLCVMTILSFCNFIDIKNIYDKYIRKPIQHYKIRKHKILFLPSDSFFFETLALSSTKDYIISIQTIDGKWYYNGLLYFDYHNKFILRVCNDDDVFYTYDEIYTNNIAYISFDSDKVYNIFKNAFKYNM